MAINYKKCTKCGSKNSIRIIYGLPGYELFKEADAGKVKLGGCIMDGGTPEYYCKDCGNEWNKEQVIDSSYRKIRRINASIGGYFRDTCAVDVDLIKRKVAWEKSEGSIEVESLQKNISSKATEQFYDQLKLANLLDWKARYASDILDGIQWSLEIFREDRNLRKFGSNAFPKEWDEFCLSIEKLVDREFR